MSDIDSAFTAAVAGSRELPRRPDNPTLLRLYALYKQATEGDNSEARPGFSELVPRAKWDAWTRLKGTPAEAAKQQYIDLVASLAD